ncbi:substrate-binding periplasmic protein [Saccharospirillum impatiens]|uniref:substrate-binding periplasmic protein n=1 Tax=Saccharospirillum impatiens TaxID=169438 RepID=UPI0004104B42|nr:ABC transporter substrate-binding protein [Saccharospirillum impatiens]
MRSGIKIILLTATLVISQAQAQVLISTGGWPPFLTPEQKHFGFIAHLISDVFAESGIEVDYQLVPWRRAYVGAVSGEYDATAVWMDAPDRHADMLYSDAILDERFVFFHRAGQTFEWQEFTDLSGLKLAGVLGYSYGPEFDAAVEAGILDIEWVASEASTVNMLLAGRIDAYPQEINVGYFTLSKTVSPEAARRITHHPKALLVNQSYLLLPRSLPDSEALLENFNSQLRAFRASGRYQTYFDAFEAGDYELTATEPVSQPD